MQCNSYSAMRSQKIVVICRSGRDTHEAVETYMSPLCIRRKALHWCFSRHNLTEYVSLCVAGILQEAMGRGEYWRLVDGQGRPPGLMGMWPSRAVTFIENHDTGPLLTAHHVKLEWSHHLSPDMLLSNIGMI